MSVKFRIHKKSRAQGNLTGRPWLVYFPPGQKWTTNGYMSMTCDGICCDTFELARTFVVRRLNSEIK